MNSIDAEKKAFVQRWLREEDALALLVDAATKERNKCKSKIQPLVFCVGFQKTGTTSLKKALKILGFDVAPFVRLDREVIFSSLESVVDDLTTRYDAFQDNPWPLMFKYLDAKHPSSKFILTTREADKWTASIVKHFSSRESPTREWIYGSGSPLGNEARYLKIYNDHNQEVRKYFANRPNDLLDIDITVQTDNWAPICDFLSLQVPACDFPHANDSITRDERKYNKTDKIGTSLLKTNPTLLKSVKNKRSKKRKKNQTEV